MAAGNGLILHAGEKPRSRAWLPKVRLGEEDGAPEHPLRAADIVKSCLSQPSFAQCELGLAEIAPDKACADRGFEHFYQREPGLPGEVTHTGPCQGTCAVNLGASERLLTT